VPGTRRERKRKQKTRATGHMLITCKNTYLRAAQRIIRATKDSGRKAKGDSNKISKTQKEKAGRDQFSDEKRGTQIFGAIRTRALAAVHAGVLYPHGRGKGVNSAIGVVAKKEKKVKRENHRKRRFDPKASIRGATGSAIRVT